MGIFCWIHHISGYYSGYILLDPSYFRLLQWVYSVGSIIFQVITVGIFCWIHHISGYYSGYILLDPSYFRLLQWVYFSYYSGYILGYYSGYILGYYSGYILLDPSYFRLLQWVYSAGSIIFQVITVGIFCSIIF